MNLNYASRNYIVMLTMVIVFAGLIFWQSDYLYSLYFENQITNVGLAVNSSIAILFLAGLVQVGRLFFSYGKEQEIITSFQAQVSESSSEGEILKLTEGSILGARHRTLIEFYNARTEINHNALAATLLAQETTRASFPKFVNNILILTGVFGTIVSLTVALLGASTAITETESVAGLNMVIHGMSTALSTTMTAILAYFVFAFFYLRLLDRQSSILGQIEHVTATVLIPQYQAALKSPEQSMSEMLVGTNEMIKDFESSIRLMHNLMEKQDQNVANIEQLMTRNLEMLNDIRQILRDGFRLRGDSD